MCLASEGGLSEGKCPIPFTPAPGFTRRTELVLLHCDFIIKVYTP